MLKNRLVLSAIILFLVINTSYYWEGMFGFFVVFVLLAIVVVFLTLAFAVFRQLCFAVKEKFSNKLRLYKIAIVLSLLTLVLIWPYGLINYEALESENILVAGREGAANCTTSLFLKQSGRFKMRSICSWC
ncbi:hypothetical protein [Mucilaginibacter lutimaris]|uniref:hypothetical protein n=1 Tax=Mucilaginibacter lutimaris TaxID=931629 RepID=UPI00366F95B2